MTPLLDNPAALLVPVAPDAASCNGDTKSLALSCSAATAEEFIFTIEIPDKGWPKMAAYVTLREVLPRALRR
jgi:hypothetical protein